VRRPVATPGARTKTCSIVKERTAPSAFSSEGVGTCGHRARADCSGHKKTARGIGLRRFGSRRTRKPPSSGPPARRADRTQNHSSPVRGERRAMADCHLHCARADSIRGVLAIRSSWSVPFSRGRRDEPESPSSQVASAVRRTRKMHCEVRASDTGTRRDVEIPRFRRVLLRGCIAHQLAIYPVG
jgi:hypothetical protein